MKKMWTAVIVMAFIMAGLIGLFIKVNWVPGKYAVKESDFNQYEPYILVQEVHYTGTGRVQTGDENGYFLPDEYVDIDLINGNVLPRMPMYNEDYANTFLCKVEYEGKIKHDAFEDEINSYNIVEWYPVYPVLRDTMLPDWLCPKGFMTEKEVGY